MVAITVALVTTVEPQMDGNLAVTTKSGHGIRREGGIMSDPGEPEPASRALRGEIVAVQGRGTTGDRTRPTLDEVTLSTSAGDMTFRSPRPSNAVEVSVRKVKISGYREFLVCPVCLSANPSSVEHVPPHSIGGGAITKTCERCNNEFGSRIEPHLLDWYDHAIRATFAGDGVPGDRQGPRLLHRENENGEFGFFFDRGRIDPGISQILEGSAFDMTFSAPDPGRVQVAILKSAYIAACIILEQIPVSDRAVAIREELAAALATPRNHRLEAGPIAESIRAHRTYRPATRGEVSLVVEPGDPPTFLVSLADVLVVDWPLEPLRLLSVAETER